MNFRFPPTFGLRSIIGAKKIFRFFVASVCILITVHLGVGCLFDSNSSVKGGGSDTEALSLRGRLVTDDGAPQSGKIIKLIPASYNPSRPKPELIQVQVSDSNGYFLFSKLPADSIFNLMSSSPGRQAAFSGGLRADTVLHPLKLEQGRVFNVSLLKDSRTAGDTILLYFPGTDIIAKTTGDKFSLDSLPKGVNEFVVADTISNWQFKIIPARGDSALAAADTVQVEARSDKLVWTVKSEWTQMAVQPYKPPASVDFLKAVSRYQSAVGAGSELYITDEFGLYQSLNGGGSWTVIRDLSGSNYSTLAANSNGLVIVNRSFSSDHGVTWNDYDKCSSCTNVMTPTASMITEPGTLLVAGFYSDTTQYVARRIDTITPATKTKITLGPSSVPVAFARSEQGQLFLGLWKTGFVTSRDDGKTWFSQGVLPNYAPFLPNGSASITSLLTASDGSLYAGYAAAPGDTSSPCLFRVSQDLLSGEAVAGDFHKSGITCMAKGPAGALFLGTWGKGIYRSFDGYHWIPLNDGLGSPFVLTMAIGKSGILYAETLQGLYSLPQAEGNVIPGQ